jgi:hypothetical protein
MEVKQKRYTFRNREIYELNNNNDTSGSDLQTTIW